MILDKRKITTVVLCSLLVFLGSVWLENAGIKIPIIRELFGFLNLLFIPGALIIAIFKIKNLEYAKFFLHAIGISIFLIMALGFIANTFCPLIGIDDPVSEHFLIPIFTGLTLSLLILYNCKASDSFNFDFNRLLSPSKLFLLLIPFLTVFGTTAVNIYGNNIILLMLIPLLALLPLFILLRFSEDSYPLSLFVIGISLFYTTTLIGSYLHGDFHTEFYLAHIVKENRYWNLSFPVHNKNDLLSIVLFIPTLSIVLGMSFNQIYKVVLPLLFSLVPVGVYLIARGQMNGKIALLSAFFFTSLHFFFMYIDIRFKLSQLFMTLIALLIIENIKGREAVTRMMLLLYMLSLVWTYFGTAYSFMIILIIAVFISPIIEKFLSPKNRASRSLHYGLVILYLVVLLSWYIYTTNSVTFSIFIKMADHMIQSLGEIFAPVDQSAVDWATREVPDIFWEIYRWLNFTSQFFIAVGGIVMLNGFRKGDRKFDFNNDYLLFSIASFIMTFVWIIHEPELEAGGNFSFERIYSLLLLFFSPLCVVGELKILEYVTRAIKSTPIHSEKLLYVVSVFFAIFLLFSSNFIMEVCGGRSISRGLSEERAMRGENIEEKLSLRGVYEQDIRAGEWLSRNLDSTSVLYADRFNIHYVLTAYCYPKNLMFKQFLPPVDIVHIKPFGEAGRIYFANKKDMHNFELDEGCYIFLSKFNTEHGLIGDRSLWWETKYLIPIINNEDKIYTNGESTIYRSG